MLAFPLFRVLSLHLEQTSTSAQGAYYSRRGILFTPHTGAAIMQSTDAKVSAIHSLTPLIWKSDVVKQRRNLFSTTPECLTSPGTGSCSRAPRPFLGLMYCCLPPPLLPRSLTVVSVACHNIESVWLYMPGLIIPCMIVPSRYIWLEIRFETC